MLLIVGVLGSELERLGASEAVAGVPLLGLAYALGGVVGAHVRLLRFHRLPLFIQTLRLDYVKACTSLQC
jgi:hypothetical protein